MVPLAHVFDLLTRQLQKLSGKQQKVSPVRLTAAKGDLQMFERRAGSRVELEARKVFKPAQPETTEYAKAQKTFHENRERLKAERLAREAATAESNLKRKPAS
jgi:hypothetical protein